MNIEKIDIKKAHRKIDFQTIEKLAIEILHEVYDLIIPAEHTNHFLKEYLSEKAIENQIKNEKFYYFLLTFENKNVGYMGIQKHPKKIILSKLYILKSFRGLKIGKTALQYVNKLAIDYDAQKIVLVVNQQNTNSINIYKKNGFKIVAPIVNSFPNGYTVNDYKMEKFY